MARSSWDELVEGYLGGRATSRTRKAYGQRLKMFTDWCAHNSINPLHATSEQIRRFLVVYMVDMRGLSNSAAGIAQSALRGLYKYAEVSGAIAQAPVIDNALGRQHNIIPVQSVSRDSARRLLSAARDCEPRVRAVVRLLAVCGVGPGEIEALDVSDLSPGAPTPELRVDQRRISLDPETAETLEACVAGRAHGPMVTNADGVRLNRGSMGRLIKSLARRAAVEEPVTPIQLRHTAIVTALAEGAAADNVASATGKTDLRNHQPRADLYRSWIPPAILVAAALAPHADETEALLIQAERLAADEGVHPAAGLVLAVAALERLLRQVAIQEGADIPEEEKQTIEVLAGALRGVDAISTKAKKAIDPLALPRNDAAHGRFERIDRETARSVVKRVQALVPIIQGRLDEGSKLARPS